jgi:hypothetical protein
MSLEANLPLNYCALCGVTIKRDARNREDKHAWQYIFRALYNRALRSEVSSESDTTTDSRIDAASAAPTVTGSSGHDKSAVSAASVASEEHSRPPHHDDKPFCSGPDERGSVGARLSGISTYVDGPNDRFPSWVPQERYQGMLLFTTDVVPWGIGRISIEEAGSHLIAPDSQSRNREASKSRWLRSFVFHASCWDLLDCACYHVIPNNQEGQRGQRAKIPHGSINVDAFYRILLSMPTTTNCQGALLNWSHSYGRLFDCIPDFLSKAPRMTTYAHLWYKPTISCSVHLDSEERAQMSSGRYVGINSSSNDESVGTYFGNTTAGVDFFPSPIRIDEGPMSGPSDGDPLKSELLDGFLGSCLEAKTVSIPQGHTLISEQGLSGIYSPLETRDQVSCCIV